MHPVCQLAAPKEKERAVFGVPLSKVRALSPVQAAVARRASEVLDAKVLEASLAAGAARRDGYWLIRCSVFCLRSCGH